MDEDLDALLTQMQGDMIALKMLFLGLVDAVRARGILSEAEIAELFDGVLSAAEDQPHSTLREVMRRSVERLMRK